MPGPSKVIVLDPDPRAGRQVQFGFEREGIPTWTMPIPADAGTIALGEDDPGLVVVGGADGKGLELVRIARKLLDDRKIDVPVVFAGKGVRRTEVEAAGADEVVLQPAYLRDLVTIGRLMRGLPSSHRGHLVGSLVETTGVYTLVRALSALGRSAVLTLIRGLRRGEVRFFHGEVTSAQVGLIHGQAALHQLLLWTDARFDFHHEDVVRRQQIPLAPDELFADAERFLEGVRDESGKLSPSMVLEQDVARVQNLGKQIPTEVHGVLRMFDGHRVLADVLEDSPYRVFETLRVTQRAVDAGLLRVVETQRPKATWRAVLAIEEWLVGGQSRDAVIERMSTDSGPVATGGFEKPESTKKASRRARKKRRANTPLAVPIVPKIDIDWGSLVPRVVGAEVGPLSGVVPAAYASGEIEHVTRDLPREGLEALMDTGKRERIFPTEIGMEPSVVFDEADERELAARDQRKREEAEAKERADREALAAEAREHAAAQAKIRDALARQERDREETAGRATAEDVKRRAEAANRVRVEAEAKAKADADAKAKADADADAKAKSDADAKARADADAEAKAKSDADARAKADAEASAKSDAEASAKSDAEAEAKARREAAELEAKAKADTEAKAKVDAETKAKADAETKAKADADGKAAELAAAAAAEAKLKADAEARKQAEADAKAENEARAKAEVRAKREARLRAEAEAEAEEKARRDAKAAAHAQARAAAEASARAELDAAAAAKAIAEAKLAEAKAAALKAEAELRTRAEERARADAAEQAAKLAAMRAIADTVTASEPSSASELVKQLVATERAAEPRPEVKITPAVTVVETPMATVTVHETVTVTAGIDSVLVRSTQTAIVTESTPAAVLDEPSDGVVHHISSADTAPTPPRQPDVEKVPADDDRPRAAGGEIRQRPHRPTQEPDTSAPTILVSDIAAVHTAVAAVVAAQAAAPASPDAASSSRDRLVAEVRKDAVQFSDAEEAFFRAGSEKAVKPPPPTETFEDLDEGYQPQGFWDRLIGKKPEKPKKK